MQARVLLDGVETGVPKAAFAMLELEEALASRESRLEALLSTLERKAAEEEMARSSYQSMVSQLAELQSRVASQLGAERGREGAQSSERGPDATSRAGASSSELPLEPTSPLGEPAPRSGRSEEELLMGDGSAARQELATGFGDKLRQSLHGLDGTAEALLTRGHAELERNLSEVNAWGRRALSQLQLPGLARGQAKEEKHISVPAFD
jgi:hypothetical protein